MKRVVYIGNFELPDKNAAAQRVMANVQLLRMLGCEVNLIGVAHITSHIQKILVDGCSAQLIPYPQNGMAWLRYITEFVSSEEVLEYAPTHVILYNFPAIASLRILNACHRRGIKVIHDSTEWEGVNGIKPRDIIRWIDIQLRMHYCMKRMDGVIAISRYLYRYYKNTVKTIMVPPLVDLENMKWMRGRLLSCHARRKLIFAGSLGHGNKDRLDLVVDAVSKNPALELTILGVSYMDFLRLYPRKTNVADNVCFMGRLSHPEAIRAVCDADFQLIIRDNTRKNNAGFSTKFVESMACCTPVITTKTSNLLDYLQDGVNGFVVDESHTLSSILSQISNMDDSAIICMKQECKKCKSFDFRQFADAMKLILE